MWPVKHFTGNKHKWNLESLWKGTAELTRWSQWLHLHTGYCGLEKRHLLQTDRATLKPHLLSSLATCRCPWGKCLCWRIEDPQKTILPVLVLGFGCQVLYLFLVLGLSLHVLNTYILVLGYNISNKKFGWCWLTRATPLQSVKIPKDGTIPVVKVRGVRGGSAPCSDLSPLQ